MTIHHYLADTMVNAALGGQYSMLDKHSATCSYPQVHDFHEIALTVKGNQVVTMGDRTVTLRSGELLWVRPWEVHSKSGFKDCTQLNVSFTQETVDAMIAYFDDEVVTQLLTSSELMPILPLSMSQQAEIRQRLDKLNFLSSRDLAQARIQMRILLAQVLGQQRQLR